LLKKGNQQDEVTVQIRLRRLGRNRDLVGRGRSTRKAPPSLALRELVKQSAEFLIRYMVLAVTIPKRNPNA